MAYEHKISDDQFELFKQKVTDKLIDPKSDEYRQFVYHYYASRPLLFGQRMLPEHFKDDASNLPLPTPPFHHELLDLLMSPEDSRLAIAAPRGHAKSTITSFLFVLHAALYAHRKNIVLISSSEDMAVRFLRRIKAELEFNPKLLHVFQTLKTAKWAETEIVLTTGVTIHARGRGAQLRGLISGANRPDLIVLDDIEDEELVRSEIRRADLEAWFNGTVLPTLSPKTGKLVFIGTILHDDSLLNKLLTRYSDFTTRKYSALLADDTPLWPERFSVEFLHSIRSSYAERHQLAQFFMEYMNDPTPASISHFHLDDWQFYEPTALPPVIVTECAVDLGGGSSRLTADETSFMVGSTSQDGVLHLRADISDTMGTDTDRVVSTFFEIYRDYHPSKFIVEKTVATNFLKATLDREMRTRQIFLPITYVTPPRGQGAGHGNMSDAKFQRISALAAPVKDGKIKVLPVHTKLIQQAASFPRGKHDDRLDALAYLWMYGFKPAKLSKEAEDDPNYHSPYQPLYDDIGV